MSTISSRGRRLPSLSGMRSSSRLKLAPHKRNLHCSGITTLGTVSNNNSNNNSLQSRGHATSSMKNNHNNTHTSQLTNSPIMSQVSCRRGFHSSSRLHCAQAQQAQEQAQAPESSENNEKKEKNPKIIKLVNEIAQLNMLEVAEFVTELKAKLNLPDTAMMGAAPMMMAAPGAAGAAPAAAAPAEEEEPQQEQTIFEVVLKSFPDDKKVSVIKEVRAIFGLGLKEAKQMVEKAPVTLQSNCPKVDAEAFKEKLSATGAEIVLE